MQAFKCKICGGNLNIEYGQKIVECEYCGVRQTISIFKEPNVQEIYDRANGYLANNEYDKAENLFAQLLFDDKQNADAYWNILMCHYGVNYVKDPATGKYIPTCNRTLYTPIFSDENYKKALEYASDEQRVLYEENAKVIDEIQKGIIAVSKHEKPFDIFISYKETDKNGNRTKDSIVAADLYDKLTAEGYKVFFSRITLADKAGTEYEPYIYSALYSSKVMLTVCSSRENMEAVWVRNEWGRFMSLQQKDADKTIIPLYFDMEKSDLPDEFSLIPSFDMKEEGFEAELIRSIKKLIPLPIMIAKKRKALRKTLTISGISFVAVVAICCAFVVPSVIKGNKYQDAMKLFKNQNYTEAQAIFKTISGYKDSKEMVERCELQLKYDEAMKLFDNQKYTEAQAIFETIKDYEDSEYMMERCDRQPEYDKAMQYYYDGKYAQSAWAFKAMGDYEDAAEMQKKAELSWRRSLAKLVSGGEYNSLDINYINEYERSQEHGRVISISKNGILYEDGYYKKLRVDADAAGVNDAIVDSIIDWEKDIILKADGTVEGIPGWENIVNIASAGDLYLEDNYMLHYYAIIGIKADGTLCYITEDNGAVENAGDVVDSSVQQVLTYNSILEENIGKFNNVKSLKIGMSGDVKIVALTHDGKLQVLSNGKFQEKEAENICDIISADYLLTDAGELIAEADGHALLRDVVYGCRNQYLFHWQIALVTRNGSIYIEESNWQNQYETKEIRKTDQITTVWDEWTARLK